MDSSLSLEIPWWLWAGFNGFVAIMLALDLGVFHRKAHVVGVREALAWSGVWIGLAMVFNLGVWYYGGSRLALEFLTGYVVEKALSIDNVFVFVMIFALMKVPKQSEHTVLFWGVLGAIMMRAAMIFAGVALIDRFHFLIYIFGAFLIFTGFKMLRADREEMDVETSWAVRLFRRVFRVTPTYEGERFLVRREGRIWATPLLLTLVLVEVSDLIFAVDSIPAILAITDSAFIVYTSNIFAILGLRSLYFALAGFLNRFYYLKYGLAAVLLFVGAKMTMVDIYHVPIGVSLGVIASILVISIAASWNRAPEKAAEETLEPAG